MSEPENDKHICALETDELGRVAKIRFSGGAVLEQSDPERRPILIGGMMCADGLDRTETPDGVKLQWAFVGNCALTSDEVRVLYAHVRLGYGTP